jgi:hypothetical protein
MLRQGLCCTMVFSLILVLVSIPVPGGTAPFDSGDSHEAGLTLDPIALPDAAPELSVPSDRSPDGLQDEPAASTLLEDFAGIGYNQDLIANPTLAVGPSHVVTAVNRSLAVYDKSGSKLLSKSLFDWFSNVNPSTSFIGNPKLIYDPWVGRFVLVALANRISARESFFVISISKTSSALGEWWNYKLDASKQFDGSTTTTSNYATSPQLGYDSGNLSAGALYLSSNQVSYLDGKFQYGRVRILKKSIFYSGGSASWFDFWSRKNLDGSTVLGWMPVHTLTAMTGEYLVNTEDPYGGDGLTLWKIIRPTASHPTLSRMGRLAVRPYTIPPDAVQKGSTKKIYLGSNFLQNAVFRNDRILTCMTERTNFAGGAEESAIRWWEIQPSTKTVGKDQTYGSFDLFFFSPSITVDTAGNQYMVFNVCGASLYPSVWFTSRRPTDATMTPAKILKLGKWPYTRDGGSGRVAWGYSGITRDRNTTRIWMMGEYAESFRLRVGTRWGTWIGVTHY